MLVVLTAFVMLAVTYAFWQEGLQTAFCTCVNVVLAGLVAFCLFEPLADALDGAWQTTFLSGYEDCLSLVLIFAVVLGGLRLATNSIAPTNLEYPGLLLRAGGVLFGLLTGYLVAGFLLCAVQTLPLPEHFLQFEAKVAPGGAEGLRRVLPPDRVWLAMMHRASAGPFTRGGPPFDADGSFEFRYQRLRRQAGPAPAKAE